MENLVEGFGFAMNFFQTILIQLLQVNMQTKTAFSQGPLKIIDNKSKQKQFKDLGIQCK